MRQQKACAECGTLAGEQFSLKCGFCGATSFKYIQDNESIISIESDVLHKETKFRINKDNINWKITISLSVLLIFTFGVAISQMTEIDRNSYSYKKCLYEAKMAIAPNTSLTPDDARYADLLDAFTNFGASSDAKICTVAFSDLQKTWDNNGGRLNLRNWSYLESIQKPNNVSTENSHSTAESASSAQRNVPLNDSPDFVTPTPTLASTATPSVQQFNDSSSSKTAMSKPSPTTIQCIPNQDCPVGSVGPAGGVVFFDAGTKKSWGRYLEVSLKDLPEVLGWCPAIDNKDLILGTLRAVGSGAENTSKIKKQCAQTDGNAGVIASRFTDGGYTDWFIPSKDELGLLIQSAAWNKLEALAWGWHVASSTQFEQDSRYEWAFDGSSIGGFFGGPVLVPMVRNF